jgi:signal transduction histidine kinase
MPSIEDRHLAEGIAFLAGIATLICVTAAAAMPFMRREADVLPVVMVVLVCGFADLTCYVLSRLGHYRVAGAILMAIMVVGTTGGALLGDDPAGTSQPLMFTPIALFIAGFLFSVRATAATAALMLLVQLPLLAAFSAVPSQEIVVLALMYVSFGGLIAATANAKERHLAQIRGQHDQVIAAAKMSALGEMAGGIAHEINTPLSVIVLRAYQIKRMLTPGQPKDDQVIDLAGIIEQTAHRIARIVQSLRDFSRDDSADPIVVSRLRDVIDNTLMFCEQRFRDHGVVLTIEPFADDLTAVCRPSEIAQILVNLLNNACDAVMQLEERWVKVSVQTVGAKVRVQVADSGAGIPPTIRARIFDPFFTTKEIGKGTGVGLSISARLAASNGGSLALDATASRTTFVVTLRAPSADEQLAG